MGRSSQGAARWAAVSAIATALAVSTIPGAQASPGAPSGASAAPSKPVVVRHVRQPGSGDVVRRVNDRSIHIAMRFHDGRLAVTLRGTPRTTYRVRLEREGGLHTAASRTTVRTGSHGRSSTTVPARFLGSRTASVTARVTTTERHVVHYQSASLFLGRADDGRLVQAGSEIGLRLARIRADHQSQRERSAALHRLFRAPAREVGPTLVTQPASLDDDQVEVHGVARWTDWNGATHPARHIQVQLLAVLPFGGGYSQFDTTTTDDTGAYDFVEPAAALDGAPLQVEFDAQTSASATYAIYPSFPGPEYYQQNVDAGTGSAGHAITQDITIGNQGQIEQSFAITDALWSAHLYAGMSGGGDESRIHVQFPSGDNGGAFTNGLGMTIGAWEWSAWDVVNHEYGHWFDMQHDGITDLPGGEHCVNSHLASNNCGPVYGKDKGTALAWSEGFANYYSVSAGHYAPHPAIATVGDGDYDDTEYDEDAVFQAQDSFHASADGNPSNGLTAEDNEMAVSGVLYNLEATGASGSGYVDHTALGPEIMMGLLENSDSSRLSDFVQFLWPDDFDFTLSNAQQNDLGCMLQNAEISPYDVQASGAALGHVPTITWFAGNADSFENNRFQVDAFDPATGRSYFTSPEMTGTSWTPTGHEWNDIAAGRGDSVQLRVTGWQDDDPGTGPYRGCRTTIALDASSPIVSKSDCQAVELAANDDGSTDAVDLPFPVNFFGTTYTFLYVNNNGNVTFDAPQSTYTPFTIDANTPPMIAPLFADVDTRGEGSAPVSYGFGTTTFQGHTAFCVNWINVGYFADHYDKLDSAQLLLVDRSDQGVGDFDIVFNYGDVQWETGDASGGTGGFGGSPVAVGYSAGNGDPGSFFQLPGSLQTGELVDGGAHALSTGSIRSTAPGRYVFPVRSGSAGNSATGITGTVTSGGQPVEGARIQVCPHDGGTCVFQTRTSFDGSYTALGIPAGTYDVTAYPPSGLRAKPVTVRGTDVADQEKVTVDLSLDQIDGLPNGTTLTPVVGSGDEPMVFWQDSLHLHTRGCPGGSATYSITGPAGETFSDGPMDADGQGGYDATIPPLYPHHGEAHVHIDIFCLAGVPNESVDFDIYIDPAGAVVDQDGHPVEGASVTLERSDAETGPFEAVPDGSDLMSPANRANPTTTGADGAFGWDVVAGFYRVTATKAGCTAPDGGDTVSSAVLPVPPEVTGIELVLVCPRQGNAPPTLDVSPRTIEGNTTGGYRGALGGVTVSDPDDDPATILLTNDAPAVLPLGTTQVTWTATDPAGGSATAIQQVTVVDTSAPSITCPNDVSVLVGASVVLGQAGASDVVDPAPSVSNDRPATFGPGRTTVTWRADDHNQNASTCQQHVTVSFPFVGFKAPVDNPPVVNTLKAGQAVPVKFSLLGDRGLGVLASGSPSSRRVDCDSSAPTDPIETTTTSQSGLQYDAASDTYTYVWKTDKAWAGTCRQLTVALADGSAHTALFQLR